VGQSAAQTAAEPFGGPSAGTACGGNPILASLPLIVMA
jgi:hypothetical protein